MNGPEWVLVLVAATGLVLLTFAVAPRVAGWVRFRWHTRRRRTRR